MGSFEKIGCLSSSPDDHFGAFDMPTLMNLFSHAVNQSINPSMVDDRIESNQSKAKEGTSNHPLTDKLHRLGHSGRRNSFC